MTFRPQIILAGSLFLLVATPRTAAAEPITITRGEVVFIEDQSSWTLLGDGLDIRFGNDDLVGYFQCGFEPCQAAAQVSATPEIQPFAGPPNGRWSMTVNGMQIEGAVREFFFFGVPFELPSSSGAVTVASQFVSFGNVHDVEENLVAFLTGHGTASMSFLPVAGGLKLERVAFRFESPQPVPEPTTLLLFATGAAALGRRAWRRRIAANVV